MPKNKDFKRIVRDRQRKTGESYTAARAQLLSRPTSGSRTPLVVAVNGAAGRVAYNLLFRLASGDVFGADTPIALRLVDIEAALPSLEGTVMELEDCAFPCLSQVDVTANYRAGFADASFVLLLGAPRRTAGMERGDLLALTASSFAKQGRAIQDTAASEVRTVVVGNPANTNCLCAREAAPDVADERWFAMLRLDQNRARAQLAEYADVPIDAVGRMTVWGNHSATMVPDAWHATIAGMPATDRVSEEWMIQTFIPAVQQRGARLIDVAGASSAASAASALTDTLHDIVHGTSTDVWTSVGVVSHGEYGIPEGIVCGFPVSITGGVPRVVEGLEVGVTQRKLLDATAEELVAERALAVL